MNFWTKTQSGIVAHVNGARDMKPETLEALHGMIDAIAEQMKTEPPSKAPHWKIQGWTNEWIDVVSHSSESLIRRQFARLSASSPHYRLVNPLGEVVEGDR